MTRTPYEQAFSRIRAEYTEMPGMRLTAAQVQRLSGVDISTCQRVLNDLVRAKFLRARPDGTYARLRTDASRAPATTAHGSVSRDHRL